MPPVTGTGTIDPDYWSVSDSKAPKTHTHHHATSTSATTNGKAILSINVLIIFNWSSLPSSLSSSSASVSAVG
ncbi:hypothetical protein TYRP_022827 [Tyrophagus putrescentiae]|nr:hypothetical protein TYRP_022827 [Tyrophagus putrescentiae]